MTIERDIYYQLPSRRQHVVGVDHSFIQVDVRSAADLDSSLASSQTPFGFWKCNKLKSALWKLWVTAVRSLTSLNHDFLLFSAKSLWPQRVSIYFLRIRWVYDTNCDRRLVSGWRASQNDWQVESCQFWDNFLSPFLEKPRLYEYKCMNSNVKEEISTAMTTSHFKTKQSFNFKLKTKWLWSLHSEQPYVNH